MPTIDGDRPSGSTPGSCAPHHSGRVEELRAIFRYGQIAFPHVDRAARGPPGEGARGAAACPGSERATKATRAW